MFIQLMPIVVLILVSILSQMMVSPPPYSLYSRPYVHTLTQSVCAGRTFCLSCSLHVTSSIQNVKLPFRSMLWEAGTDASSSCLTNLLVEDAYMSTVSMSPPGLQVRR